MKTKIFIDGSEGTTGLRIHERISVRNDIELLTIDPEKRKDPEERKKLINASDITFLCLPDAAAVEAVAMAEGKVRIIDASTAHRTLPGWNYGFPELSPAFREGIKNGSRVAVPGCHASGFIACVYPLIKSGMMAADYPVSAFSLTGYSGGGKKMIAQYESEERSVLLDAPREYAMSQQHKHLKEMKAIPGLAAEPLFTPIVSDYYSGMVVSVPLYTAMLSGKPGVKDVWELFNGYYTDGLVQTAPFGAEAEDGGFMAGNKLSGWDGMKIYVTGNDDRVMVNAVFDNLGKGASGAAIQCFNIMTGAPEGYGLNL